MGLNSLPGNIRICTYLDSVSEAPIAGSYPIIAWSNKLNEEIVLCVASGFYHTVFIFWHCLTIIIISIVFLRCIENEFG